MLAAEWSEDDSVQLHRSLYEYDIYINVCV